VNDLTRFRLERVPMSDEASAYHEAGHALLAVLSGARVISVTIDPDWDDGPQRYGDTQLEWAVDGPYDQAWVEKSVLVALAGPVAEMIHCGEPFHPGLVPEWASDWRIAWEAAAAVVPDDRKRLKWLEECTRTLHRLLSNDDHWSALAAIVDHLLAHETLEGDAVDEIIEQWLG
jgi:ATP-dependent Zn protease